MVSDQLSIGETVTRNGSDVHVVTGVDHAGDLVNALCIVPDDQGVFKVGDSEWNLARRYSRVKVVGVLQVEA